jgi:O-antigen/teichoic acid export membrane protein
MLVNPVYNAVFPRLAQLVANGDQSMLGNFYHESSEMLAGIVVPAVVVLALYSEDIIFAWTGNRITASHTGPIVALMAIGTGMHGLAHVPWGLQLSYGWTRLGFVLNLAAVILFVPIIIVLAKAYGAIGGAAAWALVNTSYLLASQVLMHRRLLKGEMWRWFLVDVARPASIALLVAGAGRLLIQNTPSRVLLSIELIIMAGGTLLSSLLIAPRNRIWLKSRLVLIKRDYMDSRQ